MREARLGDYRDCAADDCDRVATRRGHCQKHYARIWRYGSTDDPTAAECGVCGFSPVRGLSLCCAHFMKYHRILRGQTVGEAHAILEVARAHKERRALRAATRRDAA